MKGFYLDYKKQKQEKQKQKKLKEKHNIKDENIIVVEKNNVIKEIRKILYSIFKIAITIIIFFCTAIGIISMLYPTTRQELFNIFNSFVNELNLFF